MPARIILKMHQTLDGYVSSGNGSIDWISETMCADLAHWIDDMMLWQAGYHLMGHRAYSCLQHHFATFSHPLDETMQEMSKLVFSRDLTPDWNATSVIRSAPVPWIARLKMQTEKPLLVHGGICFARTLLKAGLIDVLKLIVHPVILGHGIRLIPDPCQPYPMTHQLTLTFQRGVVVHEFNLCHA